MANGCGMKGDSYIVPKEWMLEIRAALQADPQELLTEAHEALGHAIATIKAHVPEDALGVGGNPEETRWFIRDEYLSYMQAALDKLSKRINNGDDNG
jgi:hypothetical protein